MDDTRGSSMAGASLAAKMDSVNNLQSVYETDEFRMYVYKVLPCSKRSAHDWRQCPFSHPGERAKRRNLRHHSYDCVLCPEVVEGQECKLGSFCPHSHNVFEALLHPQRYRTMMCRDKDKCTHSVCFFAHEPHQLRAPDAATSPAIMQLLDRHQQNASMDTTVAAAAAAANGLRSASMETFQAAAGQAAAGRGKQWQAKQGGLLPRAAQCGFGTSASATAACGTSPPAAGPVVAAPPAPTATPAVCGISVLSAGAPIDTAIPSFKDIDAWYSGSSTSMSASSSGGFLPQQLKKESLEGAEMSGMQQLVSSLVNEINLSSQAAEQSRAAAAAQEQWQALAALESNQHEMEMLSLVAAPSSSSAYVPVRWNAAFVSQVTGACLSPGHATAGHESAMFNALQSSTASMFSAAAAATCCPSDCSSASSISSFIQLPYESSPSRHSSSVSQLLTMAMMHGAPAPDRPVLPSTPGGSGVPPHLQCWQLNGTSCFQTAIESVATAGGGASLGDSRVPQVGASGVMLMPVVGTANVHDTSTCTGTAPAHLQQAASNPGGVRLMVPYNTTGSHLASGMAQGAHPMAALNEAAGWTARLPVATASGIRYAFQ